MRTKHVISCNCSRQFSNLTELKIHIAIGRPYVPCESKLSSWRTQDKLNAAKEQLREYNAHHFLKEGLYDT